MVGVGLSVVVEIALFLPPPDFLPVPMLIKDWDRPRTRRLELGRDRAALWLGGETSAVWDGGEGTLTVITDTLEGNCEVAVIASATLIRISNSVVGR